MDLRSALLDWDGKSSSDIEEIYVQFSVSPEFAEDLLLLVANTETDRGATWCLKRFLESGGELDASQVASVLNAFVHFDDWQAQLHLLQCLDSLPVQKGHRKPVERTLRAGLSHKNKFVKAWSYNGLAVLARQYAEMQSEVMQILEMGLRDEPASVKARIRNAIKVGF